MPPSRDGLEPVLIWQVAEPWSFRLQERLAPAIELIDTSSDLEMRVRLRSHPYASLVAGVPTTHARDHEFARIRRVLVAIEDHPEVRCAVLAFGAARLHYESSAMLATFGVTAVFQTADGGPTGIDPLVAWLTSSRPRRLPNLVWSAISASIDGRATRLLEAALGLAVTPYTVEDLAVACKCSSRTLHRRCIESYLGPPQRLKAISRLLVVGYLMDCPGARLEDVAARLGFDSADAVRLKVSRFSGLNVSQMSRNGWMATLIPLIHVGSSDFDPLGAPDC